MTESTRADMSCAAMDLGDTSERCWRSPSAIQLWPDSQFGPLRCGNGKWYHSARMDAQGTTNSLTLQCYCERDIFEICKDLLCERIPDKALTKACCWSRICQSKEASYVHPTREMWSDLCRRRAWLLYVPHAIGTITNEARAALQKLATQ